jgi:hypothetical protein
MATAPRSLVRISLVAAAVAGLALGACGGDDAGDDSKAADPGTSTTTDAGDLCKLLTLEQLHDATGETFTKSSSPDADACEYANADGTAAIRLAVHELAEDEKVEEFMAAGQETCDEGSIDQDPGIDGADPAFTCLVDDAPLVAGIHDGTVYLLQGVTADESVTPDQIVTALAGLLPRAYRD